MYGLRLPDRDTALITQSKDFKHLLEPQFVGVFAMSAGIRTVSNLTPFLGMGEVIIDSLLQFLSCSKRTNFLLRLRQVGNHRLPITDLESPAAGGLEQSAIDSLSLTLQGSKNPASRRGRFRFLRNSEKTSIQSCSRRI